MKYFYFFVAALLLTACGTQKTPETKTAANVVPIVEVEQPAAPEPEVVKEPEPVKPVFTPEREALEQALAQQNREQIDAAAHKIIDNAPKSEDAVHAYCALADIELAQRPDTARLYIERAAEIAPKDAQVQLRLGRIAHAQNLDDEALSHFSASAEADTTLAEPCVEAAAILIQYLDLTNAMTQAQCAYDRAPQDCRSITILADALYANKQFDEAAKHYQARQNASCPQSETALKNLAKLYETHLSDPQNACRVYTELAKQYPQDPNYSASRDYQCGL